MELSDGEDDCNDQETPIFSGEFNQDEKTDTSNTVHKQCNLVHRLRSNNDN